MDSLVPSGRYGQDIADTPMTTGSARARLSHGLKLDDLELSAGSNWTERQHSVSLLRPFPDTKRLDLHEVQPPAAARAREICR